MSWIEHHFVSVGILALLCRRRCGCTKAFTGMQNVGVDVELLLFATVVHHQNEAGKRRCRLAEMRE
jgi:hypothetical protein